MPGTAVADGCEAHLSDSGAPSITFDLGDLGDCDKVTVFQDPSGSTITQRPAAARPRACAASR